jgi:hypothetical protein
MTTPTDAQLAEKLNYLATVFGVMPTIKSPHAPTADDLLLAAQRLSREISEAEVDAAAFALERFGLTPVVALATLRMAARAALKAAKAAREG